MEKSTVYIETSVISYLAAPLSRDLFVAAHQQVTLQWWETQLGEFDIFVSQVVIEEAQGGDQLKAKHRMTYLDGLASLEVNDAAINLANQLISKKAVPEKAAQDALHIAIACVHGIDYLLTWNCKHIANARMRHKIEATCTSAGYIAPIICTPEELGNNDE